MNNGMEKMCKLRCICSIRTSLFQHGPSEWWMLYGIEKTHLPRMIHSARRRDTIQKREYLWPDQQRGGLHQRISSRGPRFYNPPPSAPQGPAPQKANRDDRFEKISHSGGVRINSCYEAPKISEGSVPKIPSFFLWFQSSRALESIYARFMEAVPPLNLRTASSEMEASYSIHPIGNCRV
ncbi:hypothetical protein CEXT_582691 [Caerostris extrusa]|uniref:Uncharacterized protein n=1 Tax=Caerostris extrusa TaxID=172846 RepID=A0AAV4YFM2_CAEEX|nr:hypothetical protein CEXT_582691 [Caerostris extrusa]